MKNGKKKVPKELKQRRQIFSNTTKKFYLVLFMFFFTLASRLIIYDLVYVLQPVILAFIFLPIPVALHWILQKLHPTNNFPFKNWQDQQTIIHQLRHLHPNKKQTKKKKQTFKEAMINLNLVSKNEKD
jgi:hypothetical protein